MIQYIELQQQIRFMSACVSMYTKYLITPYIGYLRYSPSQMHYRHYWRLTQASCWNTAVLNSPSNCWKNSESMWALSKF